MADLDPSLVQRTLTAPPFHSIDGVINCRDIGLSAGADVIRPGLLFRSGELTNFLDTGKAQLTVLGICTVFGLRGYLTIIGIYHVLLAMVEHLGSTIRLKATGKATRTTTKGAFGIIRSR